MENTEATKSPWRFIRPISLIVLTFQNVALILIMRYVRVREGDMFMASTAVVVAELFKVVSCLVVLLVLEDCSPIRCLNQLNQNVVRNPTVFLKVCVPSIIYVVQNNMLYVALSNLEAATFQVTYQLKILTTALFSVTMLRKSLSRLQWFSLFLLFIGVAIVQLESQRSSRLSTALATTTSAPSTEAPTPPLPLPSTSGRLQNPLLGLVAVIVSCLMSGFAGVYFEKILKGSDQSIWLLNIQLGFIGTIFGLGAVIASDLQLVLDRGFFYGYDWLVGVVISIQSFGGLTVAVVVKYADNILKGFATSAAIILSCVLAVCLFDFHLSFEFLLGVILVIGAVFLYSLQPADICSKASSVLQDKPSQTTTIAQTEGKM